MVPDLHDSRELIHFRTPNAAGCDSVATLNLNVNTTTTSIYDVTICPAQLPYNWNGIRTIPQQELILYDDKFCRM
jgi:hypothetical protein